LRDNACSSSARSAGLGAAHGVPGGVVHDRDEPGARQDGPDHGQPGKSHLVGAVQRVEPPEATRRVGLLVKMPEQPPGAQAEALEAVALARLVKRSELHHVAAGGERVDAPHVLARHRAAPRAPPHLLE